MSTRCHTPTGPSESGPAQRGADDGAYRRAVLATACFIGVYTAAALAVLAHRGPAAARADAGVFGALLMNAAIAILHIRLWRALPPPRGPVAMECFGATYDPWMGRLMLPLLGLEIPAYARVGQAWLPAALRTAFASYAGLLLGLLALLLIAWADRRLVRAFAAPGPGRLVTDGPYRLARHPRYAALLSTRIAMALMLGSLAMWALVPAWVLLVRRRIRLEERHLRIRFGPAYAAWAHRVPCLGLPACRPAREPAP